MTTIEVCDSTGEINTALYNDVSIQKMDDTGTYLDVIGYSPDFGGWNIDFAAVEVGVALCAAYANAAAFVWKTTANMTDGTGTTLTSMNPAGTLALVYLGNDSSNVDWTKAKVVDTATPNFVTSKGKTTAITGKTFNFDMAYYGNGDIFGVVFKDGSDKLFYIQQGGANYMPTYTISGLADDSSNLSDFNFASSSFFGSTAPSAAVNVPEPTSALLLALGIAGLALRRKRA